MKYVRQFGTIPNPDQRFLLDTALYSMLNDSGERYWSYALGRMNFVCDDNCLLVSGNGTADGYLVTGVNFSAFTLLELDAQKCALKHICLHWLNGHVSSRIRRLQEVYGNKIVGIATDLVVAPLLDTTPLWTAGYVMPEPPLFGFEEGLSTEAYCGLLVGEQQKHDGQAPPQELAGPVANDEAMEQLREMMEGSPPAQNPGRPDVQTRSIDEQIKETIRQKPPDFIKNGKVDRRRLEQAIKDGTVVPLPLDDLNAADESGLLDSNVANLIKTASEKFKTHGWLTADGQEMIDSLKRDSVVPWNTIIRQKTSRHTDMLREATKCRPSRRHAAYFGRRHASKCEVVVWVDTSGSMGARELGLLNAELDYLDRKNVSIKVGHVDAAVCKEPAPYKRGQPLEQFFGRGGTDFRPPFDWMAEHMAGNRPDFCIYFTDGCGCAYDWEDLPGWTKQLDVVWVLTDTGTSVTDFVKSVAAYGTAVPFDTHKDVPEHKYR